MNRRYIKDGKSLWFYIGYYGSQKKGATYHSPKNCLPGGGWQINDIKAFEIKPASSAVPFEINRMLIQKGMDKQYVFYWFHDRGRVVRSEYMAKIYLVNDSITKHRSDGAMVRLVVDIPDTDENVDALASDFLNEFFPMLDDYLPS